VLANGQTTTDRALAELCAFRCADCGGVVLERHSDGSLIVHCTGGHAILSLARQAELPPLAAWRREVA
jgi:hypothetical protein